MQQSFSLTPDSRLLSPDPRLLPLGTQIAITRPDTMAVASRKRRTALKIEYMQPFVESARSTLERVSGAAASTGELGLADAAFSGATVNLVSRINGSLCGEAVWSMSRSTARSLAALMTGTEIHGFGRVMRSGLLNLTSVWREQVQPLLAEMGFDCEIGTPIILQGLNVELAMTQPALTVPVETSLGRVRISVGALNGR